MRLISCYIESFGKLSERRFDFRRGLTVINGENGFGKTTLSAFIKAMLYGLDGYKKSTKEFTDRQKYFPFGGGRYGGSLTIEFEGAEYKITRFFGEKSETEDTLEVTRGGVPTEALGENIGERVLGLDRRSFERVAFVKSEDAEIGTTDTVNRLLGGVGDGEEASFTKAIAILDEAAKKYKKQKKADARISLTEDKIKEYQDAIYDLRTVRDSLPRKYAELSDIRERHEENNRLSVAAQNASTRLAYYQESERDGKKIKDKEAELAAISERYPYGMPTEGEVIAVREAIIRKSGLIAKKEGKALTGDELLRLDRLERLFSEGVPSEGELHRVEEKISEYERLGYRLSDTEGRGRTPDAEALFKKFSGREPREERLAELERAYSDYKSLSLEVNAAQQYSSLRASEPRRKNFAFYIIAALVLLSGVGLCFINAAIGAVVMAVGAVIAAIGMALTPRGGTAPSRYSAELFEKSERLREYERRINAVLFEYGYSSDAGIPYNYKAFCDGLCRYGELKAEAESAERERQSNKDSRRAIFTELSSYFDRYGQSSESPRRSLDGLRRTIEGYLSLSARASDGKREGESLDLELSGLERTLSEFEAHYGKRSGDYAKILTDIADFKRLQGEISEASAALEDFKREKGLTDGRPAELEFESVEALADKRTALERAKSQLEGEIERDESSVERLERLECECEEARARLDEYKKTYKLLTETKKLVERADAQLKERYVKPLSDSFKEYILPLSEAIGESVTLTADYGLKLERGGALHSEKHLSTGENAICMLCYRLALMKNIYKGGEVFCILDDPFTGLDSDKMRRVSKLLRKLSENMQIIYFTCHESRDISV
ncbi:MAG: AAA family ATPase [Clostridia bacterium]|nr:AAA family ATPase [Clostridia bacterium]